MNENPRFIQGVFSFRGAGLNQTAQVRPAASYKVPFDKRAQLIYLRVGNSTNELVYVSLHRNKRPMRLFPVGAKDALHVPLAIIEDIEPESEIELLVGAPEGLDGALVLDLGLVEV